MNSENSARRFIVLDNASDGLGMIQDHLAVVYQNGVYDEAWDNSLLPQDRINFSYLGEKCK